MNEPSREPVVQQTVVIVGKQKSVGVAFLLAFLFGPLGLLYASVVGGLVMMVVAAVVGFITFGFGLIPVWFVSMIWAVVAANRANKQVATSFSVNATVGSRPQTHPQESVVPHEAPSPAPQQQVATSFSVNATAASRPQTPPQESVPPHEAAAPAPRRHVETAAPQRHVASAVQSPIDLGSWVTVNRTNIAVAAGGFVVLLIAVVALKFVLSLNFNKNAAPPVVAEIVQAQPAPVPPSSEEDVPQTVTAPIGASASSTPTLSSFIGRWVSSNGDSLEIFETNGSCRVWYKGKYMAEPASIDCRSQGGMLLGDYYGAQRNFRLEPVGNALSLTIEPFAEFTPIRNQSFGKVTSKTQPIPNLPTSPVASPPTPDSLVVETRVLDQIPLVTETQLVIDAFDAFLSNNSQDLSRYFSAEGSRYIDSNCSSDAANCLRRNYGTEGSLLSRSATHEQTSSRTARVTLTTTWFTPDGRRSAPLCQRYELVFTQARWRIRFFEPPRNCS